MDKTHKASLFKGLWINDWKYNIKVLMVFIAAEALMAFSPFGFIILPTISVTTLSIGVMVAALWGGCFSGAVVGLIFGLTSMWKASVTGVNPNDLIFSPLRSGNPMGSIILALAPRVLFGILAGLVYYCILRWVSNKGKVPTILVMSVLLDRVYSMFTYLFMDIIFHVEGACVAKAWHHLFSSNRLQSYFMIMLIILCAYVFYSRFLSQKYYEEYQQIKENNIKENYQYLIIVVVTIFIITMTAIHLWERIQIVLFDINQYAHETSNIGLIAHLIIQFEIAALAALYILVAIYRHVRSMDEIERSKILLQLEKEKERSKELERWSLEDPLTGVYNRKGLQIIVSEANYTNQPVEAVLLDIDHFKGINDTFGHNIGDVVLIDVASCLTKVFGKRSVFRLGGDEFAIILGNLEPKLLEIENQKKLVSEQMAQIQTYLSNMKVKDITLTLSVGVCFSENGFTEKLYPIVDKALYETKNNGRAGCTLIDENLQILHRWSSSSSTGAAFR